MIAKHDTEPERLEENADVRIVREMERRIAKQEAARDWRSWTITLIVLLILISALAVGVWLLPVLLMRGFN